MVQGRPPIRDSGRSLRWLAGAMAIALAGAGWAAGPSSALPAGGLETRAGSPALVRPIAVFGRDDRRLLPPAYRPLEDKIGLLYNQRSHQVCTAFCVSTDTIATAGHCLFGTEGDPAPRLTDFSFRLARQPAQSLARIAGAKSGGAAQNIASGSTALHIRPPIDATSDWALVKLSAPACKAGGLRLSRRSPKDLAPLSQNRRVYQVAFHRDFPGWKLALDSTCEVHPTLPTADRAAIARDFSQSESLILHTCDTGGASSGSPLLIDGPAGAEVAGINVGTYVQSKVLLEKGEIVHRYRSTNVSNTAVSTMAFLDTLEAFQSAEILAKRDQIRALQSRLFEHGFYSGPRDGVFGRDSRAAVAEFERSEGRVATGLPTAPLLRRLGVLSASLKAPQAKPGSARLETGSVSSHRPAQGRDGQR